MTEATRKRKMRNGALYGTKSLNRPERDRFCARRPQRVDFSLLVHVSGFLRDSTGNPLAHAPVLNQRGESGLKKNRRRTFGKRKEERMLNMRRQAQSLLNDVNSLLPAVCAKCASSACTCICTVLCAMVADRHQAFPMSTSSKSQVRRNESVS